MWKISSYNAECFTNSILDDLLGFFSLCFLFLLYGWIILKIDKPLIYSEVQCWTGDCSPGLNDIMQLRVDMNSCSNPAIYLIFKNGVTYKIGMLKIANSKWCFEEIFSIIYARQRGWGKRPPRKLFAVVGATEPKNCSLLMSLSPENSLVVVVLLMPPAGCVKSSAEQLLMAGSPSFTQELSIPGGFS